MVYIDSHRSQVVVGIDAGGSATRARALAGGRVVFEGRGGPGNPLAAGADVLASSYRAALAGCPEPAQVAACVSGTGGPRQRAQVSRLLTARFPASVIQVVPDYVGALVAAPAGTDIVVLAGTGSVVCSAASAGEYRVSGGRGWILGDRGSAARLGQAALEWFSEDDRDPEVTAHVRDCLGLADWRQIAAALSASASPSALLAKAAPVLTRAAESGSDWAVRRLNAEMAALAATTRRHAEQHVRPAGQLRVALAGGVWRSNAARATFTAALRESLELAPAHLDEPIDPLDGAVALAMRMDRSISTNDSLDLGRQGDRAMTVRVRLQAVEPTPTAVVAAATTWAEFPAMWPPMLDEVWSFLRGDAPDGLYRHGHNIMLYQDDVPNVEVGVQVSGSFAPAGRVVASALPGGLAATATHTGPIAEIGATHRAVCEWCTANGYRLTGPHWEIYGDPDPSTGDFDVEVFWSVAAP